MISAHKLNGAATRSQTQTEAFIALIRYVRGQVECFALPIGEILRRCDKEILGACSWHLDVPPQSLEELADGCEFYDSGVERIFMEFASSFGQSYREDSVRECDYYLDALTERERALMSELPKKKKLNATLCISGALALIILFI